MLLSETKLAKNSRVYKQLHNAINSSNNYKIRPCVTVGRGVHRKYQDETDIYIFYLKELRLNFELTNDAPRGGKTGNLINVIKN